MAVTSFLFTKGIKKMADNDIDFSADTIKIALCTAVPSKDSGDFFDGVTELGAGNGYTAGGETLASKLVTAGTSRVVFDCADIVWNASGGSIAAAYAVIYKDLGGAASADPLLGYIDFGETVTATDGNSLTITIDATDGIFLATN